MYLIAIYSNKDMEFDHQTAIHNTVDTELEYMEIIL